jgi:hypothetical protein
MHDRIRGLRGLSTLVIAGLACTALAACGSSSSGDASSLLKQTFSGSHTVNSGNMNFSLTVDPSGSHTISGPISLGFGGPFQSLGQGKLPKSDFNVSFSYLGQTRSLAIVSTGASGYVTVSGNSYQLPATTFQKLESSFAQVAASPGGGSGSGTLSKLGINPLRWLTNPSIVGTETVGGASTTHIRAGVNVAALLGDLNTFLQKASSLGVSGASRIPTSIPDATRTKIAGEVRNPSFDVWTGTSDKTVRKLAIGLTLPVTGQVSTLLGGLNSAAIGITLQYANLNQPQNIAAPTTVRPFSEFATKLRNFESSLSGALGGVSGSSGTTGSGSTGATGATGTGSAASVQAYSQCIQSAGSDVVKMQRCASLLNAK